MTRSRPDGPSGPPRREGARRLDRARTDRASLRLARSTSQAPRWRSRASPPSPSGSGRRRPLSPRRAAERGPPSRSPTGRGRASPCSGAPASTTARPSRRAPRSGIPLVLDAEVAFELPGEARAVSIFDQRRRTHDGGRAGSRDERAPRHEQGAATRPAIGCSSSSSFMRSACRRASTRSVAAKAPRADAPDPTTPVAADRPRRRDKTRPGSAGPPARAPPGWPPWDRSGRRRSPRARKAER